MAGKVVQLQALTRDGANVNVKCATNHTDIFFFSRQTLGQLSNFFQFQKRDISYRDTVRSALKMYACVCVSEMSMCMP